MEQSFAYWLQEQLNQRDWSQGDLWRQSKAYGREVSRAQISHILNETRGAGPDTCVNIAYALGVSREEVFRARGWLLATKEEIMPPDTPPATAELIRELTGLDSDAQGTLSEALLPTVRLFTQDKSKEGSDAPSEASQEKPSPEPETPATRKLKELTGRIESIIETIAKKTKDQNSLDEIFDLLEGQVGYIERMEARLS